MAIEILLTFFLLMIILGVTDGRVPAGFIYKVKGGSGREIVGTET